MSDILLGIHGMLSGITGIQELEMEKSEADKLGKAMTNVSAQYGYAGINPKTAAWVSLAMACGSIYGPRLAAFKMRKTMEAEEAAKNTAPLSPFTVVGH